MAPTGYDNQFYGADNSNVYTGQVFTPAPLPMDPAAGGKSYGAGSGSTDFDDEPPLLEGRCALGILGSHLELTSSHFSDCRAGNQSPAHHAEGK